MTQPEQYVEIATFGQAKLVRHPDGKYELIGGAAADREKARAWVCLFMPDTHVVGLEQVGPSSK